jgi:hypothetical protein
MSQDFLWTFFNQLPIGAKFKMSDDPQPVYEKRSEYQAWRRTDPWGLGQPGKTMMVLDGHVEVMPVDVAECYWCGGEFAMIDLVYIPRKGDNPDAEPRRFMCADCDLGDADESKP